MLPVRQSTGQPFAQQFSRSTMVGLPFQFLHNRANPPPRERPLTWSDLSVKGDLQAPLPFVARPLSGPSAENTFTLEQHSNGWLPLGRRLPTWPTIQGGWRYPFHFSLARWWSRNVYTVFGRFLCKRNPVFRRRFARCTYATGLDPLQNSCSRGGRSYSEVQWPFPGPSHEADPKFESKEEAKVRETFCVVQCRYLAVQLELHTRR